MQSFLGYLNYSVVLLFGVIVSIAFAGVLNHKKNRWAILLFITLLSFVQAVFVVTLGMDLTRKLYPLITHLPLILFLTFYCKKPWLMSSVSVFSAYLCCQTRRWFGNSILLFTDSPAVDYAVQILVTIPLLMLLIRYIAPAVTRLMFQSRRSLLMFGAVPFIYYVFDYTTTVYTGLLYSGSRVAVEFIPSVMATCYYLFVVQYFNELQHRSKIDNERKILSIQANQAVKELDTLRRSQEQAAIYHHDLRHHLQYLDACIQANKPEEARTYIQNLSNVIEKNKIIRYCENETVNLILSSYAAKARSAGISLSCDTDVAADLGVSSADLCVILANGLENAFHACLAVTGERTISVITRRNKSKTFLQIQNPFAGVIPFENGLPVTSENGHGYGTKSILMTVEKLGGLCDFMAEDGVFTLRASF